MRARLRAYPLADPGRAASLLYRARALIRQARLLPWEGSIFFREAGFAETI